MNINNQKVFAKSGLIILVIVIIATIGFLLFVVKAILLPEPLSANAELSPYNYIFQIILVGTPILFLLILYLAWKLNWTLKQLWTTLTLLSWSWPLSLLIFACPNQQSDMSGLCAPASIGLSILELIILGLVSWSLVSTRDEYGFHGNQGSWYNFVAKEKAVAKCVRTNSRILHIVDFFIIFAYK